MRFTGWMTALPSTKVSGCISRLLALLDSGRHPENRGEFLGVS